MAYIELHKKHLVQNYNFLKNLFKKEGKDWAIVSKILCGTEIFLEELINLGIGEICDARISNLKKIKALSTDVETVYIKPPAKDQIENLVRYADTSFNTEFETISWISEESVKQNKFHKIIIMIELGDLREGVMGEDLVEFYASVFNLPNIEITGIGANLNCVSGVFPSEDKMIQLCLYKELIEAKFNREIPWVTGGTSIVLPLLFKKQVPKGINHFRIGDTLFFGKDLFTDKTIKGMSSSVFHLHAQIIEITEKPKIPIGILGENPSGDSHDVNEEDYGESATRVLLDIGVLDISDVDFLEPDDPNMKLIAGSSDMIVLEINQISAAYKIGDFVSFRLKYMGALRLLNSNYIEKRIVDMDEKS